MHSVFIAHRKLHVWNRTLSLVTGYTVALILCPHCPLIFKKKKQFSLSISVKKSMLRPSGQSFKNSELCLLGHLYLSFHHPPSYAIQKQFIAINKNYWSKTVVVTSIANLCYILHKLNIESYTIYIIIYIYTNVMY